MERSQILYKNSSFQCTNCTPPPPPKPLDNGDTITNPYDIANTFNDYFAAIAETAKMHKIY